MTDPKKPLSEMVWPDATAENVKWLGVIPLVDIDALAAGPELDALVAERVMGRRGPFCFHIQRTMESVPRFDPRYTHAVKGCGLPSVPPYSTDDAAALEVFLKLAPPNGPLDTIQYNHDMGEPGSEPWEVGRFDYEWMGVPSAKGSTLALAICRAALKSVAK